MKKRITVIVILILVIAFVTGCGAKDTKLIETGNITEENVSEVCEILKDAGLSNVDVFEKWVKDMASSESSNESDVSGFSDADCRMTVMLLAGDLIKYDSLEEEYAGDYLMFDVDAIMNNEEFSILKDKKTLFTTLFGETDITESGFAQALSDKWAKYGLAVDSDKCSIISIAFKTYEDEKAFVGHTGILIDCKDSELVDSNYVFVEKIAFGEPFVITLLKDESELIDVFSARADYTVEEGDPLPVVYKNDKILGELKN